MLGSQPAVKKVSSANVLALLGIPETCIAHLNIDCKHPEHLHVHVAMHVSITSRCIEVP